MDCVLQRCRAAIIHPFIVALIGIIAIRTSPPRCVDTIFLASGSRWHDHILASLKT
jgi:hypothetical protein